jgi:RNA polymerase sigma-70 factor (ECF subfamily)
MADAADRERLTSWVREFGDGLQRYLRARVRDEHAAADLVQEVFFRAWRKRSLYMDRSQDRAYLFTIADRLACDHLRRPKRVVSMEGTEPMTGIDPSEAMLQTESAAVVRSALATLSDAQQRTLFLRYFGGLTFQQIADSLGCPLGTVLSHCRRGLEQLRGSLAEELA